MQTQYVRRDPTYSNSFQSSHTVKRWLFDELDQTVDGAVTGGQTSDSVEVTATVFQVFFPFDDTVRFLQFSTSSVAISTHYPAVLFASAEPSGSRPIF